MTGVKYRYIFGAGILGKRFADLCIDYGITIDGMIDNNHDIWYSQYRGFIIYSPSVLQNTNKIDTQIYICLRRIGILFTRGEQLYRMYHIRAK